MFYFMSVFAHTPVTNLSMYLTQIAGLYMCVIDSFAFFLHLTTNRALWYAGFRHILNFLLFRDQYYLTLLRTYISINISTLEIQITITFNISVYRSVTTTWLYITRVNFSWTGLSYASIYHYANSPRRNSPVVTHSIVWSPFQPYSLLILWSGMDACTFSPL